MFERQRSKGFKFALKSVSVVPGCHGHQQTLMAWVHDVIDTYIIKLSTLTSCVPLLPYPARFGTQVDLDIFDGIARFLRNKRCFVDYDKGFFRKITRGPLLPIQVL